MHPGLRRALFWMGLAGLAVAIGAPVGAWVAVETAPESEEVALLFPPSLLRPADAEPTGPEPTFEWRGNNLGGFYVLEISGEPAFPRERTERHETSAHAFDRDAPFPPGPRVYWRVKSISWDAVHSDWSATFSFLPLPIPPP